MLQRVNTSLFELEDIDTLFNLEWDRIKTSKKNYTNINEWWDKYAKKEIKSFFIEKQAREKLKINMVFLNTLNITLIESIMN